MADIEEFMGTDIAHIRDLVRTPAGDLDTISGLINVKNALLHRLLTTKGSLAHRPLYGVGIKDYQNAVNSLTTQRALAGKIQEQFEQDPRVERVTGVSVDYDETRPELVHLTVKVKLVGYGEAALGFTPFGEGV